MEHKFTVIWRPLDWEEFRVDYVTVPTRSWREIMLKAAQDFIDKVEWDEDTPTAEGIIYGEGPKGEITGFDLITIIDGHQPEAQTEA